MKLHIIILAAGKGVRMHSNLPKVLQPLAGKPLLKHVLESCQALTHEAIHVVYGSHGDELRKAFSDEKVNWVLQKEQLGTGHAVMQAMPSIPDEVQVLIVYGDVPLITTQTLFSLIQNTPSESMGILVADFQNPSGFGRIIRDLKGNIISIVEEKDADEKQKSTQEINTGIMLASSTLLNKYLPQVKAQNMQHEYYLTDILALAVLDGHQVFSTKVMKTCEVMGVNDRLQLAELERIYQKETAEKLLHQGATLIDPTRFDVRGEISVDQDVIFDVNVIIEGKVDIGANSQIGANCILSNTQIGKNVVIKANSIIDGAIIEDNAVIGPFARIRPDSIIKKNAHVGNFVEVKKSILGEGSKANHLTYLGDTVVGSKVNIGAGMITCNYDGVNKFKTSIEDGAFIGSNVALVAPVRIGKNATVGAGSTITHDVSAGKLVLARTKQITIENWERSNETESK